MRLIFLALLLCSLQVQGNEALRQRLESWSATSSPTLYGEKLVAHLRLKEIYTERQFQPLWFSDARLKEQAVELIRVIADIADEGLLAADYHIETLQPMLQSAVVDDLELKDILLTDAFLTLGSHLQSGKVDPEKLSIDWKANSRQGDIARLLSVAIDGTGVANALDSLRPNQIRYSRLKTELARLRKLPSEDWQALNLTPSIKPGASDGRLAAIRQRLIVWGDLNNELSSQVYEDESVAAVKRFQLRHGLEADGIIGQETIRALNISPLQRSQQIVVNLERWRWLAEDFGNKFLIVNIAAYELRVIMNNETVLQKPVIVGRDYRKSPVFSAQIKYLVFNPTWTVPYKIATEDKLPEIKRDSSYLSRMGFTVLSTATSKAVDLQTIDWQSLSKNRFPYTLVQSPGVLNALGQVKFMFPNAYDVYLHDTPARELFRKSERAFSSGCIRVEDPLELAELLLRDQQWTRGMIDEVIATRITKTVHLKTPMPVHLEYWTSWVDRDGTLNFRKDIYQRDKAVLDALNKPLNISE